MYNHAAVLGKGASSMVHKCIKMGAKNMSKEEMAVKIINKADRYGELSEDSDGHVELFTVR